MTEDEAKKKWCPFVRFNAPDGATDALIINNRAKRAAPGETTNGQMCGCLASKCMAWRWKLEGSVTETYSTTDGHCGLAGNP